MDGYVFRTDKKGIYYVGDFDGLYTDEADPWGQSGSIRREYQLSRNKQLELLEDWVSGRSLCDVGCGLGYTTNFFNSRFDVVGIDISKIAIEKAARNFPHIPFFCHDARLPKVFERKFDVVVLNQLLWYIMYDFQRVLSFMRSNLNETGIVLLSNFIFSRNNQMYGRDLFIGHCEVLKWLESSIDKSFQIASFSCSQLDSKYFDFHAILSLNRVKSFT